MLCDEARSAIDETSSSVGNRRWWPNLYRHDTPLVLDTPNMGVGSLLGADFPLAPLATHGLIDRSNVLLGLSSRIVGGGHSGQHGALSSSRTIGGRPGGPTIDAWLGALPEVRRDTPFAAIRLGVGGSSIDFGTCAYSAARPAPVIRDIGEAHSFLYGAFSGGASGAIFDREERILRFAARDVSRARSIFEGGPSESAKLASYGESLDSLLETYDRLRSMDVTAPVLPESFAGPLDKFETMLSLAADALIDDLSSVAVVTSGTGGAFSLTYSSISDVGRHDMQHRSGGDPAMLQAIRQVNQRQVDAIAKTALKLQDAGILDETIIVWIGDNGEQHHSTASEFPVLVVGGQGLGINGGGRTIVYPRIGQQQHRQVSNVWNTMGYAAGSSLDDFGNESGDLRSAFGPLPELISV